MLNKFKGCLIGGAIGDALGAPIEFMQYNEIITKFGNKGITDYTEHPNRKGEFTDDTQMTLFTAEGLLRAYHRSVTKGIGDLTTELTYFAYLRWLKTQGYQSPNMFEAYSEDKNEHGWLIKQKVLHMQRAPGNSCLSALESGKMGTKDNPINDSKGCGTVMRVAPIGLFFKDDIRMAFQKGIEISAITHGHPSGYLSGGFLAAVIANLANGIALYQSILQAIDILKGYDNHQEIYRIIQEALVIAKEYKNRELTHKEIEELGGAWVAEEALAISLLCALHYEHDFEKGVLAAVNHSGDSDSTGAITGNILGLIVGIQAIPERWQENLMYKDIVEEIATDLHIKCKSDSYNFNNEWLDKYPVC